MKWTDEAIEKSVLGLMDKLGVQRMPTSTEMRENKLTGLSRAIGLTGGMYQWSERLNIPMKEREKMWTDELIEKEIIKCMKALHIKRMPVANELQAIGRNDLHCAISKSKLKYSGWAKRLGIKLKSSETVKGNKYELIIKEKIEEFSNHLYVREMSTKHPYDLLVNECVKVDVKVAAPHLHFGTRAHTFALHKKYATCDIYVCVALDEREEIENIFIIPARSAQLVTLNICGNSKYNKFKDNWVLIYSLVNAYEQTLSRHRLG
ncbi:hypothetical protein [Bacillus badius]|uniref:Restriction endonuclease n=1 Tax=Bacillus badius TaxID=1455 RepID=A0ABR5AYX7_BACBA|nr:hypothetical protein [Bacillus badius]KIL79561.1 hypothetical protein SD77_2015 [Bacillus badius]MED4716255.1 hypothetical protein [Bacillus badius]